MATTVTATIGTGKDYATIALWEDGTDNTSLVAADEIRQGLLANEHFTSGASLGTVAGATTDSTRYRELTTDAGCSFRDHASVQTNALRWNSSNGAALTSTNNYAITLNCTEANFRISKIQSRGTGTNGSTALVMSGGTNRVDDCILESYSAGALRQLTLNAGANNFLRNSLLVNRKSGSGTAVVAEVRNATVVNVTFAVTGATKPTGSFLIGSSYASSFKNVGFFGASACSGLTSTGTHTYTTCYTDLASPPSGCTTVTFDTSTGSGFLNITDGTHDFRIKTGSAQVDTGTTDSGNAANDIAGTARPSGSAYDTGCWELVAAAGGAAGPLIGGPLLNGGALMRGRLVG